MATGFGERTQGAFGTGSRIGHNRGGRRSVYAIMFDFDTDMLKQTYPSTSWNNACTDVRNYLTTRGFEWVQGSGYFGDDTIDAVRCVRIVQRMAHRYPWFTPSVRDIRMLRIEENNNLMDALVDQDDD
jgi:virulence-associated protein VapD